MTTHLDDVRELLGKYDALDVGRRMDAGGQAILEEVRTRALVAIAEQLRAFNLLEVNRQLLQSEEATKDTAPVAADAYRRRRTAARRAAIDIIGLPDPDPEATEG